MIKKYKEYSIEENKNLSNFTKEELDDILLEFKDTAEVYDLKENTNFDKHDDLIEEGKSYYYVGCARNAYVEIIYFESDYDLLIEDLKPFVRIVKNVLGFEIVNGWMYKEGFSVEYKENSSDETYLEISLVFYKPN